ncbi:MAG: hypothetical protein ACR2HX_08605 [Pyrinomonadaceae bacterium]
MEISTVTVVRSPRAGTGFSRARADPTDTTTDIGFADFVILMFRAQIALLAQWQFDHVNRPGNSGELRARAIYSFVTVLHN